MTAAPAASPPTTAPADRTRGVVQRVAMLSIVLGVAMEILILAALAITSASPTWNAILADLVHKVSWSFFVCTGFAAGSIAGRNMPRAAGLAGFIAAPVAFMIARILHKTASQALGVAAGPSPASIVALLALLKAAEYALLGWALAAIARRFGARVGPFILAGLVAGIVFGGLGLAVSKPPSTAAFASRAVNEIVFPMGCAFVVYVARAFGPKGEGAHARGARGKEGRT